MKKRVFGRKFSRSRPAREALFASLVRAFVLSGRIETTKAKAKAIQGKTERMVSLAKKGSISARRQVLADLDNAKDATEILFGKIVTSFKNKNSGFTRIINIKPRKGDNAPMVRLEWTEKIEEESKSKSKAEKKTKNAKNLSTKTKRN